MDTDLGDTSGVITFCSCSCRQGECTFKNLANHKLNLKGKEKSLKNVILVMTLAMLCGLEAKIMTSSYPLVLKDNIVT